MPLRIPEAWHKHIHWVMILRGSWFSLHQNPRDLEQKGKEPKETYISWNESIWNLLNRVSSASQQFEEWHLKFCIWQFMEMMICVSLHINRKTFGSQFTRWSYWLSLHSTFVAGAHWCSCELDLPEEWVYDIVAALLLHLTILLIGVVTFKRMIKHLCLVDSPVDYQII